MLSIFVRNPVTNCELETLSKLIQLGLELDFSTEIDTY